MVKTKDYQDIGNTGEYFIASLLSYHGCTTTITLGRAELYDILAVTPSKKTVKIQVKTTLNEDQNKIQFKSKSELPENIQEDFFYVFVRYVPDNIEYWAISSEELAEYSIYFEEKYHSEPKRDGTPKKRTSRRDFRLKQEKFCPVDWAEKLKTYYKNIKRIVEF